MFTDGSSTTRAVQEGTGSGGDIGPAVAATDADEEDTLTYTLGGTDAASLVLSAQQDSCKRVLPLIMTRRTPIR